MSLSVSLVLAILAKVICVAFGLENTISIADFVVISVIGGFLSSIVVMGITVFVAQVGVRRNWDLDNVTAPIVTAAGDMVTLPALFLATYLVGIPWLTTIVAVFCAAVALIALFASIRSKYPILRRIARESLPVLVLAGTIDVIAGLTIEKRFESFLVYPALLVLRSAVPRGLRRARQHPRPRVSTKLHLGTLVPGKGSLRSIGEDFLLVYLYTIPVFFLLGVSADIAALVVGLKSPGSLEMIAVSMLAGADRDDLRGVGGLLRRGRRLPARARPRQPRDPHRHVEPRPARRGRPDPGDRGSRPDLAPSHGKREGDRAAVSCRYPRRTGGNWSSGDRSGCRAHERRGTAPRPRSSPSS